MKLKLSLVTLCAILIIAFSSGGILYAQESGDTAEAPEAAGTDYIEPGDDELASLLTEQPNPGSGEPNFLNITVIGSISFNALNSGSTWTRTISNCAVPNTVRPGRYRLMIVTRPGNNNDNNQWRLATLSYQGAETGIDFTVR